MAESDQMFRGDLMRGQKVLVTGGGSGLGRVMAEAIAALGGDVVIAGRRLGMLEATAAEIMAMHPGRVMPVACDIRDESAIEAMLDQAWEGGAPTGLVNNAAGNFVSRTEDLSSRGFDAIASIVFRGSFLVTLGCGKRWLAAGERASVLSILTTWVWNGSPFVVPSAMSKTGLAAMTQSLAVEWGGRGIRFNAIAPGIFPTEGMAARLMPGEDISGARPENPMNRVGRMPELANLAVYLLHPGSTYVNGQVIAIDGAEYQATGGNFSSMRTWTDEQWHEARESIRRTDTADRASRTAKS
ncbi:SDR family oxidoreductase [Sphingomonas colocasiae]|uniref:SDR family oxidoreductase n=1 Tax=Sphingomonas colocasiae TaxID=1848973 RepID=A0ABS7PUK9_9SPHN|nr:SDR family oxidoreductase [Sphingomonas colocasiae]MBY8824355.1 SDR family oxidoreductase [Sphingomonas colocasiae]